MDASPPVMATFSHSLSTCPADASPSKPSSSSSGRLVVCSSSLGAPYCADAYDLLDPGGNITIKWDVMHWNDDGYSKNLVCLKLRPIQFSLFEAKTNFLGISLDVGRGEENLPGDHVLRAVAMSQMGWARRGPSWGGGDQSGAAATKLGAAATKLGAWARSRAPEDGAECLDEGDDASSWRKTTTRAPGGGRRRELLDEEDSVSS